MRHVATVSNHISQNTDDTDGAMLDPEEGELVDGQVENESNVDAVKWCGRLRRSTAPVAAPFELLNFPFDIESSPHSRLRLAIPVWRADTN